MNFVGAGGEVQARCRGDTLSDERAFRLAELVVDADGAVASRANAAGRRVADERDRRADVRAPLHQPPMRARRRPWRGEREQSRMHRRRLEPKPVVPVDALELVRNDRLRRTTPRLDAIAVDTGDRGRRVNEQVASELREHDSGSLQQRRRSDAARAHDDDVRANLGRDLGDPSHRRFSR